MQYIPEKWDYVMSVTCDGETELVYINGIENVFKYIELYEDQGVIDYIKDKDGNEIYETVNPIGNRFT